MANIGSYLYIYVIRLRPTLEADGGLWPVFKFEETSRIP